MKISPFQKIPKNSVKANVKVHKIIPVNTWDSWKGNTLKRINIYLTLKEFHIFKKIFRISHCASANICLKCNFVFFGSGSSANSFKAAMVSIHEEVGALVFWLQYYRKLNKFGRLRHWKFCAKKPIRKHKTKSDIFSIIYDFSWSFWCKRQ